MSVEVCLALGSNLGRREDYLNEAVRELGARLEIIKVSAWLETEPVDCPFGADKYLNGALLARTDLEAAQVLALCLEIEKKLGRQRQSGAPRNASRVIDLDLLFYGQEIIDRAPELVVPHSRLHERYFVLKPLAQVAGEFTHPLLGLTVNELLAEIERRQISGEA